MTTTSASLATLLLLLIVGTTVRAIGEDHACTEENCRLWSDFELDCASYNDENKTALCHESCVPKCMKQQTLDEGSHANIYPLEWADTGCFSYKPTTTPRPVRRAM